MNTIGYISRDTSCLIILIEKTQIHPARLFKASFDYQEMRWSPQQMRQLYNYCIYEGVIPIFVEDTCLDILAGRTSLNPLGCQIERRKK